MYYLEKQVGKLKVGASGETMKECFWNLCKMVSEFSDTKCGVCQSDFIIPRVRNVEKEGDHYEFPEMKCMNRECGASLSYGVATGDKGEIYAKRMKTNKRGKSLGEKLPDRGWIKYEKTE
ncbi:MAG: hypothetical protein ACFFG0_27730 [Candidatus Thorarchaeota archaeon]